MGSPRHIAVFASVLLVVMLVTALPTAVHAQPLPKITLDFSKGADKGNSTLAIQILFLITILSLAPAIMIMMTSFTRLVIVFHFLRMALGTQQAPANQIIVGLSLFLTYFIMQPVLTEINDQSIQPYLADKISQHQALENAAKPVRRFMLKQTREKDLSLFVKLAKIKRPKNVNELPTYVIIPAFVISELRIGFQLGFLVYLPLLLIDLIVGVILMSMGMMMLPPVMISMPFKILLFVLVDGWYLVVQSVVTAFR
ncbi:MAG: flagellar biosynthetic protein FliP [Calditrichaeota bacterium]|nr:MAG: flagellar biosynthetic protein FliP [Calditrichota bacterium]